MQNLISYVQFFRVSKWQIKQKTDIGPEFPNCPIPSLNCNFLTLSFVYVLFAQHFVCAALKLYYWSRLRLCSSAFVIKEI